MKRFLIFIVSWIVFILAATALNEASKIQQSEVIPVMTESENSDHPLIVDLKQALSAQNYLGALKIIDKNHKNFANLSDSDNGQAYQFFYLKGHVHSALWQHLEAEKSWTFALNFATSKQEKKRLKRLVNANRLLVNDINDERLLNSIYRAAPRTGPASTLSGKIAVVYVFLTDGALQSWSLRKRDFVMSSWTIAEQWLILNSNVYNANVEFSRRLFLVDKNPYIKRLQVGDFDSHNQHSAKVAKLVAEHLGYKDILSFIETIKKEEQADQAILIFHLSRDGRSFAQRCVYKCNENAEYVYLMESPSAKRGNFMNYAQAHETLHLFGADDLYNINGAKYYVVRDIMNYPASILGANTLEPITAYAVGIYNKKPKAPFEIQSFSRSH